MVTHKTDIISMYPGGEVTRVNTYAELLTTIIDPSHRLAPQYRAGMAAPGNKSRTRNYNDVMTVDQ